MKERMPGLRNTPKVDVEEIREWLDEEPQEVRSLFTRLPQELWGQHYDAVDNFSRTEDKLSYLSKIVENRKASLEEFTSKDPNFKEVKRGRELGDNLYALLESPEGFLGVGGTAQVKRYEFEDGRSAAVKYLITPLEDTNSAKVEHDMLWEVDTMTYIEEEEQKMNAGMRVRVPHPYFSYKDERVQCYAMEEIKGRTIEQLTDAKAPSSEVEAKRREAIMNALRKRYENPEERKALYAELDRFAAAVHTVCLHDDIKLANMMVDEEGIIYLIDFGKSKKMVSISNKTPQQIENLQTLERVQLGFCVRTLIRHLSRQEQEAA